MVEVEYNISGRELMLHAVVITYGNASTQQLTHEIAEEIETLWNEPRVSLEFNRVSCRVIFRISSQWRPDIQVEEVIANFNPRLNFYRVENFSAGNISFVDGIRSNTGYFMTENLYSGSTTAAHEFGHGIGLDHPRELDIRGSGRPGIMYPRGTWVDPEFQYDPAAKPGAPGGTMHPMHRRVRPADIIDLRLHKLRFKNGRAILGDFTNVYHGNHREESGIE